MGHTERRRCSRLPDAWPNGSQQEHHRPALRRCGIRVGFGSGRGARH